ncbi:unnamed protein product [Phytophthora fragariaefolia]|uniref:Unnamed protein product n=1 Tax=Phytophthora fragariaefolia TaxID=1490495 RepID=A0A9W6TMJ2_9STRA|nr:unnamed protein product [Phytophthora fragariaefolia]
MDLHVRAAQKRPAVSEVNENEGSESDASRDGTWLPNPAPSEADSVERESSESRSVSDVPESTSSTSEGGNRFRVLAQPPNTVEFVSWKAFDEHLATYQAQTFQSRNAIRGLSDLSLRLRRFTFMGAVFKNVRLHTRGLKVSSYEQETSTGVSDEGLQSAGKGLL